MELKRFLYILVMGVTTYLMRVIPLTLIRNKIKNRFIRSFLYYVPYATLAAMTFPAIMDATESPIAGAAALVIGMALAYVGVGLMPVALICSAVVFVLELLL